MDTITQPLVAGFLFYSLLSLIFGLKNRKNPFGLSKVFTLTGSFVWVDTVVFGAFFTLVSIICLITEQWVLFWLTFSVFWLVRAVGESFYWFLEQFASKHKNPPKTLWPYRWFKGEEIWIFMQIFWQCIVVVSLISSVYFFVKWLQ